MKDFLLHPEKHEEEALLESFFDQSNAFLHTDPAVGEFESIPGDTPLFDSELFEALTGTKPPKAPEQHDNDGKSEKKGTEKDTSAAPATPDVAKAPASTAPVPIPYPNMAKAADTDQVKVVKENQQNKAIKAKEDFEQRKKTLEPLYEEKKAAIQVARKEYKEFKKAANVAARNQHTRLQVRMKFKAFERIIDNEGLTFGTAAFATAFSQFFPGNSLSITVTDSLEARLKEAKQPNTPAAPSPVPAAKNTSEENKNTEKQASETNKEAKPSVTAEKKENNEAKENTKNKKDTSGGSGGGAGGAAGSVSKEAVDKSSSEGYAKSLGEVGPMQFVEEMKGAKDTTSNLQKTEKEDLKADLPKVEQPTGLPTKEAKSTDPEGKKPAETPKEAEKHEPQGNLEKEPTPEPHDAGGDKPPMPATPTPKPQPKESEEGSTGEGLIVKSAINTLPASDSGVNKDFGPKPPIKLEGQANPQQNAKFKEDSDKQATDEKKKADEEIGKDFGENDTYPTLEPEMLEAKTELTPPEETKASELDDLGEIPEEVKAGFDKEALEKLNTERSAEIAKADEAKTAMDTDMKKERELNDKKIEEETAKTKKEQEKAQKDAKDEVGKQRQDWEKENKQAIGDYEAKAAKEKGKVESDISDKVKKADEDIDKKITDADSEVKKEEQQAEKNAAAEKEKEKQKPKGFWDSLCDAVTSFFDAIKKAVNAIFDALRALVKTIIEAAKKAVNALIDAVKEAVKNMIKAFGEILKGLVTVLLAAFPGIRDKFLKLIDKAVDAACKLVDKLAEGLKKLVNKLLDALGAVLDAILAAYQKAINLLVDALAFIAVGLIKILKGIANLVLAAKEMPSHFWGQVSEEMLGVDITKPLPNEAPMPADQGSFADDLMEAGEISTAEKQIIQKPTMEESDVQVDAATDFQLDPVLMQQLAMMPEDGSMSFDTGEGGEEEVKQMKQEALTGQPQEPTASSDTETSSPTPTAAAPQQAGGELIGPFSGPGERLAYLAGQMKEGITKWWNDNKVAIIAGLVLGIAGVILANVLTGGAIMAALPLLMQIVGALFAAQAIANATGYFGTFLSQGFQGNIGAGAVALARATAIIVVEIVTSLLFAGKGAVKGAKKAFKTIAKKGVKGALKSGAKGAKKAAIGAVKSNVKAVKDLGKVAKSGGQALMKNGKLAVKGVKNGFGKGVKSFSGLAKKLAKKMNLKKVKIVRSKRWFKIMGLFNPWVLLASGEIRFEDNPKLGKVGDKVKVDGTDAFIVGSHSTKGAKTAKEAIESGGVSRYVDELVEVSDNPDALKAFYKNLDESGDARKQIYGSSDPAWFKDPNISDAAKDAAKKRGNLRKNLGTEAGEEAHHAITVGMIGESKVVQDAIDSGFAFNTKVNGINLKKYSKSLGLTDGIHAHHPFYDLKVSEILEKFQKSFGTKPSYSPDLAKQFTEKLSSKLVDNLDKICKQNGVKVDDLFRSGIGNLDSDKLFKEIIIEMKDVL